VISLQQFFACSLPKRHSEPEYNEDWFLSSPSAVVISDGASDSYDSRTLARLICEDWIEQQNPRLRLNHLVDLFEKHYAGKTRNWSDEGALARGSFATALGVCLEGNQMRMTAIGDSLCIHHSPADRSYDSFPMRNPEEIDPRPTLISSRHDLNKEIRRSHVFRASRAVRKGDRLLLMTDALAGWFFSKEDRFITLESLESINSSNMFQEFVDQLRDACELKNDDTTLAHIEIIDAA